MSKTTLNVRVESGKFYSRVNRMIRQYPAIASKIVVDAAEAFVRSATKETPPNGRSLKKRLLETWNDPDYAKAPAKRQRGKRRKLKAKDRRIFKVIFRRFGDPEKRGRKYFRNKQQAQDFQPIRYRGVGKAGWWGTLLSMGKPLGSRIKATDEVTGVAYKVNKTEPVLRGNWPKIKITNAADAISRQRKEISAAFGYRAADNRFRWWERKLKKDAKNDA